MHNPYFQFQQFTVWHDRCAMKVGTDGVLIGAWCRVEDAQTALDVGCGSGLISLMLAQRNPHLHVLGIDIDAEAVAQAHENFQKSPFAERLCAASTDFTIQPFKLPSAWEQQAGTEQRFSLIVSNPPFYTEDTKAPNQLRAHARHSTSLPFPTLIRHAVDLLTTHGRLAVILPTAAASDFVLSAHNEGLYLQRRCDVRTNAHKPFKRTMLELGFQPQTTQFEVLTLHNHEGDYTPEYRQLTHTFYLSPISH